MYNLVPALGFIAKIPYKQTNKPVSFVIILGIFFPGCLHCLVPANLFKFFIQVVVMYLSFYITSKYESNKIFFMNIIAILT